MTDCVYSSAPSTQPLRAMSGNMFQPQQSTANRNPPLNTNRLQNGKLGISKPVDCLATWLSSNLEFDDRQWLKLGLWRTHGQHPEPSVAIEHHGAFQLRANNRRQSKYRISRPLVSSDTSSTLPQHSFWFNYWKDTTTNHHH